jgi:CheY-like chemotaxis protein
MLEENGYQVHDFQDPKLALDHLAYCSNCNLAVSDIRLTGMSGFEFARRAKETRAPLRIILMSSFEIKGTEWQRVLPSLPVEGFILKPANLSELTETIKRYVMA